MKEKKTSNSGKYKTSQRITPVYDMPPHINKKKKCKKQGCKIILNGYRVAVGNKYCSIHEVNGVYQDSLIKYRRMLDMQNKREVLKRKKSRKIKNEPT